MPERKREINIFSMSALDLFASALGAFILISVVIFPYFPNTVAACPPARICPAPVPAPVCPVCPSVPKPSPPAAQFPHLDLVIALDVTGSMGDQVSGLKAEIDQLSEVLIGMTPSFAMGVVAFGDREWDYPLTVHPLTKISDSPANRDSLREFVIDMDVNMGMGGGANQDSPEAVLDAMTAAIDMSWRSAAERRMIVVITDNPAYPEEVQAAIDAADSFARRDGEVSTVSIETGGAEFLRDLAEAGGGRFVSDAGGSLTANVILSLL